MASTHGSRWAAGLLLALGMGLGAVAHAADAGTASAPASAAAFAPPQADGTGRVRLMNRLVATLTASMFGMPPDQRAEEAERRIRKALESGGDLKVGVQERPEGALVTIDDRPVFAVTPNDTPDRTLAEANTVAHDAAAVLQQAIDESRQARDLTFLLRAAGIALAVAAVAIGLLWVMHRVRVRTERWLVGKTLANADRLRISGVELVRRDSLVRFEQALLSLALWVIALLVFYEWVSITLSLFPFTRPWGEHLNTFLFGLLARFALAIVEAVPDLIAAALIFWIAWLLTRLLRTLFARVASGHVRLSWLDADVAPTTSKLCVGAVWLFALAMAYPYLPGSNTEAFKGLSVLLGLMISLGASNLVGQLASGLILTYTRTFHQGEFVRIDSHEGTVTSLGAFTTRIRTGMGEELTISNSAVLGAVTRNYSRTVKGRGFIVDAAVTIGYDAPWRQVEAMLVEAAGRTAGVLADPRPQVFQVALSDFYPEYRLVCQAVPSEPRPRAVVMSELHANIQDVFNEHGVQIMSPHYFGDPAAAKVVPREHWYDAPARPPAAPSSTGAPGGRDG